MTEEEKKASKTAKEDLPDAELENLSEEELDEVAGGVYMPDEQMRIMRERFRKHKANGGTIEEWRGMSHMMKK